MQENENFTTIRETKMLHYPEEEYLDEYRYVISTKVVYVDITISNDPAEIDKMQSMRLKPLKVNYGSSGSLFERPAELDDYSTLPLPKVKYVDPSSRFGMNPFDTWPWPIWARSFINAQSVGGGTFRGDGQGPSLSTDREIATSRTFVNFTFDPQKQKIIKPFAGADPTIVYAPPEFGMGNRYPIYSEPPEPNASFTGVTTTKNSLGNDIASFGFNYWCKDPVTPGFATPSLDVHSNFAISENLETGTLFINARFTGDVFPSTEAFISDQSGAKLFLGARKETGGVGDLYGDNRKLLFTVEMQIKFDKKGNFTAVQQGDKLINPEDWNKQIESQFK